MNIGLLVSGDLGFLVFQRLLGHTRINFVLTDRNSLKIIELSKKNNLMTFVGNPRGGKAFQELQGVTCDVIVSVNYLYIIQKDIIDLPLKMAINFHGSLLPKYRGRTPHVWAIINNETETGITAHVIDEECDTGDIIAQKKIPITPSDTGGSVLEKYKKEYPDFVVETLAKIQNEEFSFMKQDNLVATYFGKRTFEDGRIDWGWHRERIRNWVRAQARPYPGAYAVYNTSKVVIHEVAFSELGFQWDVPNGTILRVIDNRPIVKTPNGAIAFLDFECDCTLSVNMILE